jgi:hypothetical protein
MDTADVKPSIEAAERVLNVLKAFSLNNGDIRCAWEWIRIADAAATDEKFYLSSNTNFFRYILTPSWDPVGRSKAVFELISPYISLTDNGRKKLMEFQRFREAEGIKSVW